MVELWLPYGSSEVPLKVSEERVTGIFTPQTIDEKPALEPELEKLIQSRSDLRDAAKKANRVCLTIGACKNKKLISESIQVLMRRLTQIGAASGAFFAVLSADAPALSKAELPDIPVIKHDSKTSNVTRFDNPQVEFNASLNSEFAAADLKILIGELRPHQLFSSSGISDIVFPGLLSEASIRDQLSNRKGVDASIIHKERVKLTDSIEKLYTLGFVLDSTRAPAAVAFGSMGEVLKALDRALNKVCSRSVEKRSDIVVMSVGGTPFDSTLIRAVEAFPVALPAIRKGGVIIIAAECSQGYGGTEFLKLCAAQKEARYIETSLRHRFSYDGYMAAFLARTLQDHRVYLVSTIPDYTVERKLHMHSSRTVNSALQIVQRHEGSDAPMAVVPDANAVTLSLAP